MSLLLEFINNSIILVLIAMAVFGLVTLVIGLPYCHYIDLVSKANSPSGKEELARYLANKTGGRKIDVENTWRSFLPAARSLYLDHEEKRKRLHN